MAEKSPLDKLLDEMLKGKTPEEVLGKDGLLKELSKRLVERALEAEMTEHLGYEKHAPDGRNSGNSRNGAFPKTVIGEAGEMTIQVPRDRNGEFQPQIVPKGERHISGFDEKVIALYARGMTTREIQDHLLEIYDVDVSPALISAVTDAVLEDVIAWQNRPLDPVYPIAYLDAIYVKMKIDGHVQNVAVYLVVGINMQGKKDLMGIWVGESEGAKFWLSVLTELKNRGVQDILIACVDGLKGFPEAIETVFGKTVVQLCIVHLIRNSMKYVSWKELQSVVQDLKAIYTAPTADAAKAALDAFASTWDKRYPAISKLWRANWDRVIPFLAFPAEIRKVIYTTNVIESINSSIRKVTKKRGVFPTPESVRKLLYLAIMRASARWRNAVQDWPAALNHFAVVFEGRMPR